MRQLRSYKAENGSLTASLREAFYRVLSLPDYENFSTKRREKKDGREDKEAEKKVPSWGSIENLHDNVHSWCGGGHYGEPGFGHMSWVPVAAFDPIFWLHHW